MLQTGQLLSTMFNRISPTTQKPVELEPGQVFKGTVTKLLPDNMALVQMGGITISAKLEASLEVGQKAWLQVQPTSNPVTLKVLTSPENQQQVQEPSMDGLIRSLGISESEESRAIVQTLVKQNLPVTKETVNAFIEIAKSQGNTQEVVDAFVLAMKRNLPLTNDVVGSLKTFLTGKPISETIQQFMKEVNVFLGQEPDAAGTPSASTNDPRQAEQSALRQLVAKVAAKVSNLPVVLPMATQPLDQDNMNQVTVRTGTTNAESFTPNKSTSTQQASNQINNNQTGNPLPSNNQSASSDQVTSQPASNTLSSNSQGINTQQAASNNPAVSSPASNPTQAMPTTNMGTQSVGVPGGMNSGLDATDSQINTDQTPTRQEKPTNSGQQPTQLNQSSQSSATGQTNATIQLNPALQNQQASMNPVSTPINDTPDLRSNGKGQEASQIPTHSQRTMQAVTDSSVQPSSPTNVDTRAIRVNNSIYSPSGFVGFPTDQPTVRGKEGTTTVSPMNVSENTVPAEPANQRTAVNEDKSQLLKDLFQKLGVSHERQMASPRFAEMTKLDANVDNVKSMLLQVTQSGANMPAGLKEAAETLLQQVTGQQLLLSQPNNQAITQVVMQIPLRTEHGDETAFIQIESKKREGGQLDPDNCRLFFNLDLHSLGITMVDVNIVNKIVNINIYNDLPWVEGLLTLGKDTFAGQLREAGYLLSNLKTQPIPEGKSKVGNSTPSATLGNAYKGVDFRV